MHQPPTTMATTMDLDPFSSKAENTQISIHDKISGFHKIITDTKTGMLTTRSADGHLHSRAMHPSSCMSPVTSALCSSTEGCRSLERHSSEFILCRQQRVPQVRRVEARFARQRQLLRHVFHELGLRLRTGADQPRQGPHTQALVPFVSDALIAQKTSTHALSTGLELTLAT